MIKYINRLRSSKKGFTLVEVIIAMAVFALLSTVLAMMFQLVFKLHINTNEIDTQMDKQTTILDGGVAATEDYDTTKSFSIAFNEVGDTITANGEKVAAGYTDGKIPIRVFG